MVGFHVIFSTFYRICIPLIAISVMAQIVALYVGVLKAARYIHNRLLTSVLHWPSATFDRIPLGRILNRFSADIDMLDNTLPTSLLQLLRNAGLVSHKAVVIYWKISCPC